MGKKSQKAILTSCWWYRVIMVCIERGPLSLFQRYASGVNCVNDLFILFCELL